MKIITTSEDTHRCVRRMQMTSNEKNRVAELRSQGLGYKRIAAMLDLSPSTVQSYCRRTLSTAATAEAPIIQAQQPQSETVQGRCKQCGVELTSTHRKFCSDRCRQKYWYQHRADAATSTMHTCPACGCHFKTSRPQKYCSHECYIRMRFRSTATPASGFERSIAHD